LGLKIEIFWEKKDTQTHQQNNKTIHCFLVVVIEVNVFFNFGSRQTQAGIEGFTSRSVLCVAIGQQGLLALVRVNPLAPNFFRLFLHNSLINVG